MANKYALPQTLEPTQYRCIKFLLPDDTIHIANFWGAIGALGYARNWQDSYGDGRTVSLYWQSVIEQSMELNKLGGACVLDCNEVETCLDSSPTITAIESNITTVQGDIVSINAAIAAITTIKTEIRLEDCALQYRYVNGVTGTVIQDWQGIAGWIGAKQCFAENQAPPLPPKDPENPATVDAICAASAYIASELEIIVNQIIFIADQLGNPDFTYDGIEYWNNTTKYGVDYAQLQDIFLALLNGYTTLSVDMAAIESDIASILYCNNLNQSDTATWIANYAPVSSNSRYVISTALSMLTSEQWQVMSYIGSVQQASTCVDCGAWCNQAFNGQGLQQWVIEPYSPVTCTAIWAHNPTLTVDEINNCTASGYVQFAVRLDIPVNNHIEQIRFKTRSTNSTGDDGVNVVILDHDDTVLYSALSVVNAGSGAVQEHCLSPNIDVLSGGKIVVFAFCDAVDYSYLYLTNVQVSGIGIAPYTTNCVQIYSCTPCDTYSFLSSQNSWQPIIGLNDGIVRATWQNLKGFTAYNYNSGGLDLRHEIRIYTVTTDQPTIAEVTIDSTVTANGCALKVFSGNNLGNSATNIGTVTTDIAIGTNVILVPLNSIYDQSIRVDLFCAGTVLYNTVHISQIKLC